VAPFVRRADLAELRCAQAPGELLLEDSCFSIAAHSILTADVAVDIVRV
jgi:hypothetical protein